MKKLARIAALVLVSVPASALNIMCIGDSITQGGRHDRPEYTFRLPLQQMLKAVGRNVDFIGTRKTGLDSSPWPATFDPDHEGYYGETTFQVLKHVHGNLPKLPAPDLVLIHLGTNDRGWVTTTTQPLTALVEELRARNPRVAVLIAEPAVGGVVGSLRRRAMSGLVERLNTPASPVALVPLPAGWGPGDTFDGVHPNERGQIRLAVRFLEAITAL